MSATPRELPIAVFDSGVGGLTVLHECSCRFRTRTSSTSATPRASRTATSRRSELRSFARELAEHLLERGAKLLVVACNSATAAALPLRQERLCRHRRRRGRRGRARRPARGGGDTQRPRRADRHAGHRRERRLRRGARRGDPQAPSSSTPSPAAELAPLIQEGGRGRRARGRAACDGLCRAAAGGGRGHRDPRLHPLPAGRAVLQRALGRGVSIVTLRRGDRREVESHAAGRAALSTATRTGAAHYRFLATGDPEEFRRSARASCSCRIGEVEQVDAAPRGGAGMSGARVTQRRALAGRAARRS